MPAEDCHDFKASLVYVASTRLAWTVEGDSISKTSWRLGALLVARCCQWTVAVVLILNQRVGHLVGMAEDNMDLIHPHCQFSQEAQAILIKAIMGREIHGNPMAVSQDEALGWFMENVPSGGTDRVQPHP